MSTTRILVVEDEADIAEVLQYNLELEGFEVDCASRGDDALDAIRRSAPDLILLDLMLPGVNGVELTRILKRDEATAQIPLIMVTARGDEMDRIVGLELGADDYIPKPFSPRELVLRVQAVLRRLGKEGGEDETLSIGDIHLDVAGHRLRVNGDELPLTATEFRLLRLLMERRNRVQTRTQLLSEVWGYSDDVDSRTVDTHMRRLRRKLGDEAARIETVIGVGYRMRG